MTITWQTVITASAAAAAVAALVKYFTAAHRWYLRQNRQDDSIVQIKEEQKILTFGVLACLKGLKEQGCDGPVTAAIERIEKHLNVSAHR